jgi:predicted phosphodiesterase
MRLETPLRYLILSDTHANLEGLEACLELAAGRYDKAVCLGDLVGYGPDPNAVTAKVREVASATIRGNHDKACSGVTDGSDFNLWARIATAWTSTQLSPEHLEFLRNLPQGPLVMDSFWLVHGAPQDEDEYILSPVEAVPALHELTTQLVFFGHTHIQGGFMISANGRFQSIRSHADTNGLAYTLQIEDGQRYLINPGSTGQPRDGDRRAAFAIFDESNRAVEYYRTPYDVEKTQSKMEKAMLPDPLIRRLGAGR